MKSLITARYINRQLDRSMKLTKKLDLNDGYRKILS